MCDRNDLLDAISKLDSMINYRDVCFENSGMTKQNDNVHQEVEDLRQELSSMLGAFGNSCQPSPNASYSNLPPLSPARSMKPRKSVSRKSSVSMKSSNQNSMRTIDKLYKRLTKKDHNGDYENKRSRDREYSHCKAKPEISRNSKRLGTLKNAGIPIYKRYHQEIERKETRLTELKKSIEKSKRSKEPNPTFTPTINSKRRSNSRPFETASIEQNTKQFLKKKKEKISNLRDSLRYQESKELTFQPKINMRSSKIASKIRVGWFIYC